MRLMMKNSAPMLIHPHYLAHKRGRDAMKATLETISARAPRHMQEAVYGDGYMRMGGVAIMPVFGAMMKGGGYPDQSEMRGAMKALKADVDVKCVLKIFDSPGGSVAGTADYAEAISSLGKPTIAYCEDMCASAAYWGASCCDKIYANSTAFVGSIGVISWLTDATKYYEDAGIKEIPITTGKFKAAGDPSQPATEETIEYMQSKIDAIYEQFVSTVAKRRGISKAKIKEMNAAVFVGEDAVSNGLVDGICSLDDCFDMAAKIANRWNPSKTKAMIESLEIEAALCGM